MSSRAKVVTVVAVIVAVAVALIGTALKAPVEPGSPNFLVDDNFKIPTPPRDTPHLATANFIGTILMSVLGLVGVAIGVREWIKNKTVLPLLVAVSGAMIVFTEVFLDIMGGVYWPWSQSDLAFTVMGREMPWYVVAAWFGYGVFNFFTFKLLTYNPRTKYLWLMVGIAGITDVLMEELLLHIGIFTYYGNQPLIIFGEYPWWWLPCNSVGVFLAAAIAYRYRKHLQGWRALSMFLITPASVGAVYGFVALPSWIAVNGQLPWLPTQLLGLLTFALGVVVFAFILGVILKRPPFQPDYIPPLDDEDDPVERLSAGTATSSAHRRA